MSDMFDLPSCKLRFLKRQGFETPTTFISKSMAETQQIYLDYMDGKREALSFDIDGLVIIVDDFAEHERMGYSSMNPNFGIAYKFDSMTAISTVRGLEFQVGGTGRLTPVVHIDPILVCGVTISKASMHNIDILNDFISNGFGIGCEVVVSRANDVIPQIVAVSTKVSKVGFDIPTECPECGSVLALSETGKELRCNANDCGAKTLGTFMNFFNIMEYLGVSEKFVQKCIDEYQITTIPELLSLSKEQFLALPGFAERSSELAYNAIHPEHTTIAPSNFMALLNISSLKRRKWEQVLKDFSIDYILSGNLTVEELVTVEGIADITAQRMVNALHNKKDLIIELQKWFTIAKEETSLGDALAGKIFVITGKLTKDRKSYEKLIAQYGGSVKSGVNSKTDYLVTNEQVSTSSKFVDAQKMIANGSSIQIITEEELVTLLGE